MTDIAIASSATNRNHGSRSLPASHATVPAAAAADAARAAKVAGRGEMHEHTHVFLGRQRVQSRHRRPNLYPISGSMLQSRDGERSCSRARDLPRGRSAAPIAPGSRPSAQDGGRRPSRISRTPTAHLLRTVGPKQAARSRVRAALVPRATSSTDCIPPARAQTGRRRVLTSAHVPSPAGARVDPPRPRHLLHAYRHRRVLDRRAVRRARTDRTRGARARAMASAHRVPATHLPPARLRSHPRSRTAAPPHPPPADRPAPPPPISLRRPRVMALTSHAARAHVAAAAHGDTWRDGRGQSRRRGACCCGGGQVGRAQATPATEQLAEQLAEQFAERRRLAERSLIDTPPPPPLHLRRAADRILAVRVRGRHPATCRTPPRAAPRHVSQVRWRCDRLGSVRGGRGGSAARCECAQRSAGAISANLSAHISADTSADTSANISIGRALPPRMGRADGARPQHPTRLLLPARAKFKRRPRFERRPGLGVRA